MARRIYDLVLKGQQVLIAGKKNSYLVDRVVKSSIFQAHIQGTSTPVMIKTERHPMMYKPELDAHEFNCIRNSPYITSMYEAIDNGTDKCMVFEWLDHNLWSLRYQKRARNSALPKTAAKSVLQALTALSNMDGQGAGVHADIYPHNIMVSDADSPSPTVKLGDLGNLIPAGSQLTYRLQGHAIRAPEIWMGRTISPACDVWALGVSLANFLAAKQLFGPSGFNLQLEQKARKKMQIAYSIAKIIQLVGPIPWDIESRYTKEFDLANALLEKEFIKVRSLETELSNMEVPEDCVEFIRYLLTLDPHERPTAEQALKHPWLHDTA
ncbi:CMGC protein kinase [Polytolypa hystricis UAMH7299]|uniref:CMGC protein kinase n=1 Tax=Polytolypa hystricis (strain UAMH7299) TaxID=1447883 RepID=A0A2B7YEA5_POLH7|nr:CMGC protein kinase [Polytolypa hystricis UAMH7299]